jgi:hypothetical protein
MTAINQILAIAIFCAILGSIWTVNYAVSIDAIHNQWRDEANATGYEPVDTPWHTMPLKWISDNVGVTT